MAFTDKLKNLTKQAQEAVAENKDKLHEAVEAASAMADEKTHGKYSDKIAKYGQKADEALEKLSASPGDAPSGSESNAAPSDSGPNAAPSEGPKFDD